MAMMHPATRQTLRNPCASATALDISQSAIPTTMKMTVGFASLMSIGMLGSVGGLSLMGWYGVWGASSGVVSARVGSGGGGYGTTGRIK